MPEIEISDALIAAIYATWEVLEPQLRAERLKESRPCFTNEEAVTYVLTKHDNVSLFGGKTEIGISELHQLLAKYGYHGVHQAICKHCILVPS